MDDASYEAKYLGLTRALALAALDGRPARVFLFGSRARGTAARWSDYDLAVSGLSEEEFRGFERRFREAFDESIVPHEVDLIDLDRADRGFAAEILKDATEWTNDSERG